MQRNTVAGMLRMPCQGKVTLACQGIRFKSTGMSMTYPSNAYTACFSVTSFSKLYLGGHHSSMQWYACMGAVCCVLTVHTCPSPHGLASTMLAVVHQFDEVKFHTARHLSPTGISSDVHAPLGTLSVLYIYTEFASGRDGETVEEVLRAASEAIEQLSSFTRLASMASQNSAGRESSRKAPSRSESTLTPEDQPADATSAPQEAQAASEGTCLLTFGVMSRDFCFAFKINHAVACPS